MIQHRLPLLLQLPLEQGLLQQGRPMLLIEGLQGRSLAAGQCSRPGPPGLARVELPQHDKAAVIHEPIALLLAPGRKGLLGGLIPAWVVLQQRLRQGCGAALGEFKVQSPGLPASGNGAQILLREQAGLHQGIGIQEPGVQGEGAGGAVGGAQAVGGGQGQHLPGLDALAGEGIDPLVGGGPKGPAGRCARQRRDVQQDPSAPHGLGSL